MPDVTRKTRLNNRTLCILCLTIFFVDLKFSMWFHGSKGRQKVNVVISFDLYECLSPLLTGFQIGSRHMILFDIRNCQYVDLSLTCSLAILDQF